MVTGVATTSGHGSRPLCACLYTIRRQRAQQEIKYFWAIGIWSFSLYGAAKIPTVFIFIYSRDLVFHVVNVSAHLVRVYVLSPPLWIDSKQMDRCATVDQSIRQVPRLVSNTST